MLDRYTKTRTSERLRFGLVMLKFLLLSAACGSVQPSNPNTAPTFTQAPQATARAVATATLMPAIPSATAEKSGELAFPIPANITELAKKSIENANNADLPQGARVVLFPTINQDANLTKAFVTQAGVFKVGDSYILRTAPHNLLAMQQEYKGREIFAYVPGVGAIPLNALSLANLDIPNSGFPQGQKPFGYIFPPEIVNKLPEDFQALGVAPHTESRDNLRVFDAISGNVATFKISGVLTTNEPGLEGPVRIIGLTQAGTDIINICQGASGGPVVTQGGNSAFQTIGTDPTNSIPDPLDPARSCSTEVLALPLWQQLQ